MSESENQRFPLPSNARPDVAKFVPEAKAALVSESAPALTVPELKLGCPITKSGTLISSLLSKGFGNRRIRLLPVSTTYKLPFESMANAPGVEKPSDLAVPGPSRSVDWSSNWPRIRSALAPLENWVAFLQPRTRLLKVSETKIAGGFDVVSTATAHGEYIDRPSTTLGFELRKFRDGWPTTRDGVKLSSDCA